MYRLEDTGFPVCPTCSSWGLHPKSDTGLEQAVAAPAPVQASASDADIDGEKLYAGTCAACHSTGAAGAPKPGSPEMAQRAEKGMDALMQTAVNGLNAMPARGGRPDLSDAQMQAIIEFMLQ